VTGEQVLADLAADLAGDEPAVSHAFCPVCYVLPEVGQPIQALCEHVGTFRPPPAGAPPCRECDRLADAEWLPCGHPGRPQGQRQ
jgi:hypothetical protein